MANIHLTASSVSLIFTNITSKASTVDYYQTLTKLLTSSKVKQASTVQYHLYIFHHHNLIKCVHFTSFVFVFSSVINYMFFHLLCSIFHIILFCFPIATTENNNNDIIRDRSSPPRVGVWAGIMTHKRCSCCLPSGTMNNNGT